MNTLRIANMAALCVVLLTAPALAAEPTAYNSVRPLVGTADHGHVFPGASVPFGMVQLSPDTRDGSWDGSPAIIIPTTASSAFRTTTSPAPAVRIWATCC